jgi:hypothetical protein
MSHAKIDLSETVMNIKEIVESEHPTTDVALAAIAEAIELSSVSDDAKKIKASFKKFHWDRPWPNPNSQLKALELALAEMSASEDLKYLAAAKIFSADDDFPGPDNVDPEILAICDLYPDDDGDDHSQPKPRPRWIVEWGLRRRRQHVPK